MEGADFLWVEKYRPLKIDDMVLPEKYITDFNRFIKLKEIPHLLFAGPPGCGKTTCARILTSTNGVLSNPRDNLLIINGSKKATRNISFVEDVIEEFIRVPPFADRIKIVFIDEFDYFTTQAFSSLRHIIEKYSSISRFIATCNYINKLPEAIQSRFQIYKFKELSKNLIFDLIKNILVKEGINFDENSVIKVINGFYPDIRKMINYIQEKSSSGNFLVKSEDEVTSNENKLVDLINSLIDLIMNNDREKIFEYLSKIINILENEEIDYLSLYRKLFSEINYIPLKLVVSEYVMKHSDAVFPEMNFMGMIYEFIKIIKKVK